MEIPLLLSVAAIAVVDSLNPTAITILLLLLSTPKPETRSTAFILGVFVGNFAAGAAVTVGLSTFLGSWLRQFHGFQEGALLIVGVLLIAAGIFLPRFMEPRRLRQVPLHPWQGFLMGTAEMALELPTALPYLAAIGMISREPLSVLEIVVILLMYNVIFVFPLLALLAAHRLWPHRRRSWASRIAHLFRHWLPKLLRVLLIGFGVALLVNLALGSF